MRFISILLQKITRNPVNNVIVKTTPSIKDQIIHIVFGKYLLTTNTISSGLLMIAGDIMAQEINYRRRTDDQKQLQQSRYDWNRTGIMFIVGSLQGPLHHYFYRWMDQTIVGTSLHSVTKKILLDQLVMSPVCIMAFFYPAGWLNGQTIDECNREIQKKFSTVYLMDWLVWPATQFINFYYLHPRYRVIYVNLITMLYNIFLSYIKYK